MSVREVVNAALRRTTGRRPTAAPALREGDRLLDRPAFILSSVRSGSTLLRVLLNSHSELHAPHELHIRGVTARMRSRPARRAMAELGLDRRALQHLLWDRLLHQQVARHGKRRLVNKTPTDVFIAARIRECWPDARFIFLLRHPAAIAASRARARPQDAEERNVAMVLRYVEAVERARTTLPGLVVRYEDLTADPEAELRRICTFLDVAFEPGMLEYDRFDHGDYKVGLGDWTDKIRSGTIHPPEAPPEHVPAGLRAICEAWGYAPGHLPAPQA